MRIYRTITGKEYDLDSWPKEHLQFLRRAYWHYIQGVKYEEFIAFILGPQSPVLNVRKNGPKPTRTPLYDVVTDLQGRLGVKQGLLTQDWVGEVDPDWPLND